jgi:ribonuclease P protein component
VVVGKKTARSAVARTQLRRRIYAALGNITPLLANTHTIVLTTKQAAAQTTSELEAELRALIARLRPDSKGTTDAVE